MSNVLAQDTEVVAKAKRRQFTAEYKRGILSQAASGARVSAARIIGTADVPLVTVGIGKVF